MRKGTKFINTDILKVMKGIVDSHTNYYKSDFVYDVQTIKEAALKKERTDRIFVWMCRQSGTWLLKEKNVFIRDSHEYSVFTHYMEQTSDSVLCFIVEVAGSECDTAKGNLYFFDYPEYYDHIKKVAVPAKSIAITYENGKRIISASEHFHTMPDTELGKFVSFQFIPESAEQLECVLIDEKRTRNKFKEDYEVLYYEIYENPTSPTENGKYYGKTSIKEQAENVVLKAKESGEHFFIKAVCSDGKKRYI